MIARENSNVTFCPCGWEKINSGKPASQFISFPTFEEALEACFKPKNYMKEELT